MLLIAALTAGLAQATSAAPAADAPVYYFESKSTIVAEYPHKLVIFERPADVSIHENRIRPHKLQPGETRHAEPHVVPFRAGKEIDIDQLKVLKTFTFQELIYPIYFAQAADSGSNLFVCSNLLTDPNNQCQKNHHDSTGETAQFCGIISMSGDVIYKFPIMQQVPMNLASPLLLLKAGKKAALGIGKAVYDDADCGYESVSNFKEVWIWEYPDKLTKHQAKDLPTTDSRDLRRLLATGQL